MDIPRAIMWLEIQLVPWLKAMNKLPAMVVWDNMAAHTAQQVIAAFADAGILLEQLPPCMTDRLQVMDLIVNRLIKDAFRRASRELMWEQLQKWRETIAAAKAAGQGDLKLFDPHDKTEAEAICIVLDIIKNDFTTTKFKDCVADAFVEVGLRPDGNNSYRLYSDTPKPKKQALTKRFLRTWEWKKMRQDFKVDKDTKEVVFGRRTEKWTKEMLDALPPAKIEEIAPAPHKPTKKRSLSAP